MLSYVEDGLEMMRKCFVCVLKIAFICQILYYILFYLISHMLREIVACNVRGMSNCVHLIIVRRVPSFQSSTLETISIFSYSYL